MDIKKIENWLTRGTKWVKEGQTLALEALEHLDKTGDIGCANRMVAGMPKGTKRNALAEWFLAFGKLKLNEDKTTSKDKPFVHAKDKTTNVAEGTKKPWYEFQPEPPIVEVFDAQAVMLAALNNARTKAGKAKEVLNLSVLDKVAELLGLPAAEGGPVQAPEEADPLKIS